MKNPHEYLDEIRCNLERIRAQGTISPAENALFGMIDGLGGLLRQTLVRVTELERRMVELHGPPATQPGTPVERPAELPAVVYPPM
jgi:hypothetical protein